MREMIAEDEVDLEFILQKETFHAQRGDKTTLAHYIYVDLIAQGHREVSFVIGIAEEQSTADGDWNTSGVVIDITTAAQRKKFTQQVTEFSENLGLHRRVAQEFSIEGLPAINETFEAYCNVVVGPEVMYRIILDLKSNDELSMNNCADKIEKYLAEHICFEATDEPFVVSKAAPTASVYSSRYNQWGSW
jgi:hypothetical protein